MSRTTESLRPDIALDPFQERSDECARRRLCILGARFEFESRSSRLLELVDAAYAGLPQYRLRRGSPTLVVRLEVTSGTKSTRRRAPPALGTLSGAGFLCGSTSQSSFAVLSPATSSALVVVPEAMLGYTYHTRYELIEFAVFTLASRTQRLVPLHAACVGRCGRGFLLMGGSGAGKSTLALHCLLHGFDFVSEDSTFVTADSLHAMGVANFLHVRADSLGFVSRTAEIAMIRNSPVIRRRSGIAKFEVDLRKTGRPLAARPLMLDSLIFMSRQASGNKPLLTPLTKARVWEYLDASQPYAAGLREWRSFKARAARLDAFELRRGRHPEEAVAALADLASRQSR